MSLTDELERLGALQQKGALTEAEFAEAKTKLLAGAKVPSKTLIWGICRRLGEVTPIPGGIWRLLFLLPVMIGFLVVPFLGSMVDKAVGGAIITGPVFMYFALWLVLGEDQDSAPVVGPKT
jgi:phage shock protein C